MPRITLLAYVDPEAFRKILSNLIGNAIKYAQQAAIVRLLPFNSYDSLFFREFKNDGYIVPYEMKDRIFEPFFRLSKQKNTAGTGIGLPLSRSLTELHKGNLELKPSVDHFNNFLLSMPIHQENEINLGEYESVAYDAVDSAATNDEETRAVHDVSVLVVEDNQEIVHFLQKELQESYNIYKAGDGQKAVEICQRRIYI